MSIFTEAQAKAILDKVIALSKADQCIAQLKGSIDGNVRFALNNVSTSGIVSNVDLSVEVAFGKRVGIATINEFDDAALERCVRRAEDLAKLAPENPEFVPAVEKQAYKPTATFSPATAAITPDYRAQVAADSIQPCKAEKLVAAGFLQDGQSFVAFANSKGNFGYQQATNIDYTCTVRTDDGRGSGWVGHNLRDAKAFDASADIRTVFGRDGFVNAAVEAKELKPLIANWKASQTKNVKINGIDVQLLTVPVDLRPGDAAVIPGAGNQRVNPWRYVSTNPTNNPASFDLWAEVPIGKKEFRIIGNWKE